MPLPNTLQLLLDLIKKEHHLDITGVTLETGLADVGLDSLALAELIFSIEDTFHVELGDMDPRSMPATVGELVTLIDTSNSAKAEPATATVNQPQLS